MQRNKVRVVQRNKVRFVQRNKVRFVQRNKVKFVQRNKVRFVQRNKVKFVQRNKVRFVQRNKVRFVQRNKVRFVQRNKVRFVQRNKVKFVQRNKVKFVQRNKVRFVQRNKVKFVQRNKVRFVQRNKVSPCSLLHHFCVTSSSSPNTANEETGETHQDLFQPSERLAGEITEQRRNKSAELLKKELQKQGRFASREYLTKVNLAMAVLYARHVLTGLLAQWPSDGPLINAALLGCKELHQIPCVLDLLFKADNRDCFKKVGAVVGYWEGGRERGRERGWEGERGRERERELLGCKELHQIPCVLDLLFKADNRDCFKKVGAVIGYWKGGRERGRERGGEGRERESC